MWPLAFLFWNYIVCCNHLDVFFKSLFTFSSSPAYKIMHSTISKVIWICKKGQSKWRRAFFIWNKKRKTVKRKWKRVREIENRKRARTHRHLNFFFLLQNMSTHFWRTRRDRMLLLTIPKNTQHAYGSRILENKNKNKKKQKREKNHWSFKWMIWVWTSNAVHVHRMKYKLYRWYKWKQGA